MGRSSSRCGGCRRRTSWRLRVSVGHRFTPSLLLVAAQWRVDLAVIGPGDLATSINKRGLPDDPEVVALMKRAEEGIMKSGVPIGVVARTAEQANQMIDRGYLALALGFDWSLFQRGIAASLEGIKIKR